jgi:hypothetical protein
LCFILFDIAKFQHNALNSTTPNYQEPCEKRFHKLCMNTQLFFARARPSYTAFHMVFVTAEHHTFYCAHLNEHDSPLVLSYLTHYWPGFHPYDEHAQIGVVSVPINGPLNDGHDV